MEKQEIESYIKAGEIAKKVKEYAKNLIKKDMLLIEIAEKIDSKISELGGKPAFPVNLSLNEIAAHYTPSLHDETKAQGILKIDLGVEINGYIADCAFSLDLTEDKKFEKMIESNKEILAHALENIKPEIETGKIGTLLQEKLEEYNKKNNTNFSIIKNLSGHSLGKYKIHSGLTISNYKNSNPKQLNDIAIAIEPFLTTGRGEIYESENSEIYMLQNESKQVRDKDAREFLDFIKKEYKTKPFCKRWLEKTNKFSKLNFSLKQLVQDKILYNIPILIEKSKQPVSQEEESVLIFDGRAEIFTR